MTKRILAAALALASTGAFAQTAASLTNITPGVGYFQDFSTLGTTSTTTAPTNGSVGNVNSALNGFFVARTNGTSTTSNVNILADTGASNAGAFKNLANATDTGDRALGGLRSGTFGQPVVGLRIRNNTGAAISLVGLDFAIEQYRDGGGAGNTIQFSYSLFDSTVSDVDFATALAAGTGFLNDNVYGRVEGTTVGRTTNDVVLPTTGGPSAGTVLDGNLAANRVSIQSEISLGRAGLTWAPGQDIAFRFIESVPTAGSSSTFGVDNVRVVPEPASMAAMALGLGTLVARRRRRSSK